MDIRILGPDDLAGAMELSTLMGWNQRLEDWRTLTGLAPSGSFAALDGRRVVGTAIGIDYRRCGWVAMMLVDPGCRGRGLGTRLLQAALGAIPAELPVGLDATPLGRPLYERHGFLLERSLTRYVRPAAEPRRFPAPPAVSEQLSTQAPSAALPDLAQESEGRTTSSGALDPFDDAATMDVLIQSLEPPAVEEAARIDERLFGADRSPLFRHSQAAAPQYARCARTAGPISYSLGRAGRLFDHLGPIVATDAGTAMALTAAAAANAGGNALVVDAYDANPAFTAWLQTAGFEAQRPLYRMWRAGTAARTAEPDGPPIEFAILGPEFG